MSDDKQKLKIELLSQWKLEAESRKINQNTLNGEQKYESIIKKCLCSIQPVLDLVSSAINGKIAFLCP